jgi:hypothetical protein
LEVLPKPADDFENRPQPFVLPDVIREQVNVIHAFIAW